MGQWRVGAERKVRMNETKEKQFLIQAEHMCFSYPDDSAQVAPALNDVSLAIEKGSFVCLIGHNGSGKSTLAKLFNLILTPSSGRLCINGIDVTDHPLTDDEIFELRRNVGMVFQNPDNQLVATIVEEDVAFGPENLGVPPEQIRARVDAALDAVGMRAYRHHAPHLLSGGQKQRVAIAGILAMQPACIILDEATAMLDPVGRREVLQTIRHLNRDLGITIVHITHYMDEAAMADRVVVLSDGRILEDGRPRDVFVKTEALRAAGLDVPQVTDIMHSLRRAGLPVSEDLLQCEEAAQALAMLWQERYGQC